MRFGIRATNAKTGAHIQCNIRQGNRPLSSFSLCVDACGHQQVFVIRIVKLTALLDSSALFCFWRCAWSCESGSCLQEELIVWLIWDDWRRSILNNMLFKWLPWKALALMCIFRAMECKKSSQQNHTIKNIPELVQTANHEFRRFT